MATRKAGSPALSPVPEVDDSRYFDFDAARKSQKPIRFKMRGEVYGLPSELPVEVVLSDVAAYEREDLGSIVKLIQQILGTKNYNKMVMGKKGDPNSKIDIKDLWALTRWVAAQYGLDLPKEEEDKNPPA